MTMKLDVHQKLSEETYRDPSNVAREEHEPIAYMKDAVSFGKSWSVALLEAIGLWTQPEEELNGRKYRYLLHGEAFDWLLLAERFCDNLDGYIPPGECERLLFNGVLPLGLTLKSFKEMLGHNKYRAILNFWYGVVVEEAIQLSVEGEVRKEKRGNGHPDNDVCEEEAFQRLYEDGKNNLFKEFRSKEGYKDRHYTNLTELKEFTYWLFKLRINKWDPARVASDTRKGLRRLHNLRGSAAPFSAGKSEKESH